jgi:hypothetical protein
MDKTMLIDRLGQVYVSRVGIVDKSLFEHDIQSLLHWLTSRDPGRNQKLHNTDIRLRHNALVLQWDMRKALLILAFCLSLMCLPKLHADDLAKRVKKSVELSTLDQPKTPPFHLKASLAPSLERDRASGRTGEVEIWWETPERWRRDVRCPVFRQIQIVDGDRIWQKNEGDYFPEWLRETANALIHPVPVSDELIAQVKGAEVRNLMGGTYLSWTLMSGIGDAQKGMGAGISMRDDTGLLFTASGFGWGGLFHDYASFHNRKVAHTVSVGSPEVTAKITTLEDLGPAPTNLFDATAAGADQSPIRTVLLEEQVTRKNQLSGDPASWPPLKDGPLEGLLTTEISIDRTGKIRDIGTIVSDNPGVSDAARQQIATLQFKPFLLNGTPVQAVSRFTLRFKTARPEGVETFESARTLFERGRKVGFPAAGTGSPYVLHAEFQTKASSGQLETGHYEDTWISDSQWHRGATLGSSHYARSRNGERTYLLSEGPDTGILAILFQLIEPIPALDTFVESDWRINSESVGDTKTVRVLSGYEGPDGKLDAQHSRAFWFDPSGILVETFVNGIETRRSNLQDFESFKVAHRIDVLKDGGTAMRIQITDIATAAPVPAKTFEIKGHEWKRIFTAEAR